jgi:hypothetical protein
LAIGRLKAALSKTKGAARRRPIDLVALAAAFYGEPFD